MNELCEKVFTSTENEKSLKSEELRSHEVVRDGKIRSKCDLSDLIEKAVLV